MFYIETFKAYWREYIQTKSSDPSMRSIASYDPWKNHNTKLLRSTRDLEEVAEKQNSGVRCTFRVYLPGEI